MKKSNFYLRYRNVGISPCVLSIFFLPYMVEKGVDYFGITLVKMSNFLIAEIYILVVLVSCLAVDIWFMIQLARELYRARFTHENIDRQVILKIFFGKLAIQLVEKWRGKNDCKKL